MFGTSPTPKFEYDFAFSSGKDVLVEITIDGQKTDSQGTGSLKGTFPAAGSAETGVVLKLASSAGTSSPPSDSSNANKASGSTSGSSSGEIKEPGTWGLFKFVDRGGAQKQENGEYLLKYNLGGKSVSATIKPSGGVDLFDKSKFRQVKAPQTMIK